MAQPYSDVSRFTLSSTGSGQTSRTYHRVDPGAGVDRAVANHEQGPADCDSARQASHHRFY